MLRRLALVSVFVAATASAGEPKQPAKQPPPESPAKKDEGVIDPRADSALRKMSDTMAGLKSFRIDMTTIDEKVTKEGQKIQEVKDSQVSVRRPNLLRIDRLGPSGHVTLRYDGINLTVYNKELNAYATTPAPPKLDAAIDDARDRLNIDAPAGDLMLSDPYHALIGGVKVGRYIGLEPIGGLPALHLAMTEKNIDWQIWIQDGQMAIPLRYVITSKDMPGQPQFTAEMYHWVVAADVTEKTVAFTPPANAKRVEFPKPKQPLKK